MGMNLGILALSGGGSGGGGAAFSTIQPDSGTSPVATGQDTLTLTSSDSALDIVGNAATDTIDFKAGPNLALLGGRSGGQTLNGGTGSGENLSLVSTAHATKGKILFGTAGAYNDVEGFLGIGLAAPTYRGHFQATADRYDHGVAISHLLGLPNALTRFYQDLNGTFSIANPYQLTTTLVSDPFGKVGLSNGATSGVASVNIRTHPDYLSRCSLMLTKVASQTGKLLVCTDTDFSTEVMSINLDGKLQSAAGNESAATLGTAAATEYLAVLLSTGATRYIPLVTTPN